MNIFSSFYYELIKPLYELFSTPFYKIKFLYNISNFKKFKKLIKYDDALNNKLDDSVCLFKGLNNLLQEDGKCRLSTKKGLNMDCYYPCGHSKENFKELFLKIDEEKLKEIYLNIKKDFKYNTKPFRFGKIGNRSRWVSLSGKSYYNSNYNHLLGIVYKSIMAPIIEEQEKINKEKIIELKQERETLRHKLQVEATQEVRILRVLKSKNPFQNYANSIRIEYKIEKTGEQFLDYLTDSEKDFFQYKTARFLIATDTVDLQDIFDNDFDLFKKRVEGKRIFVDIKRDGNKIKVDNLIGAIFYKENI